MRPGSLMDTIGLSRLCRDRDGPSCLRRGAVTAARGIVA